MTADGPLAEFLDPGAVALLRAALDASPVPAVLVDGAMNILLLNAAMRDFLGEPEPDATSYGALARLYVSEASAVRLEEAVRRAMAEGAPHGTQDVDVTARREHTFRLDVSRLDLQGPALFVISHLDLTPERLRIEELERLRLERERTQRIARVGSWFLDLRTSWTTWSPEMYVVMGQDPATFVPSLKNRRLFHADSAAPVIASVEAAMSHGQPFRVRYEIIRPGGGRRLIENVGEPQRDEQGELIAYFGTVRDVTDEVAHEQELERERQRLERAQSISHTGDIEVELATRDATASPEFRRLFDLPDDVPVGMDTLQERVHPDDRARMSVFWLDPHTAARLAASDVTYRVVTRAGEVRHLRGRAQLRTGADGREFITAFAQDVTEQARAAEELRLSEQRLRAAEAIAHIGHWEWFVHTGGLTWSDQVFHIVGVSRDEEPTFERFMELVHPDDRKHIEEALEASFDRDEPYEVVHRLIRPDGGVRTVLERGELSRDTEGQPYRMLGIVQDITDAVDASEQLRLSEARLRAAEEIAGIGSWEWDTRTGKLQWSDEVYRIYGCVRGAFNPSAESFLRFVHPEDRARVAEETRAVLRGDNLHGRHHRIVRPDGAVRVVRRNARVVERDERGRAVRLVGTTQDITEAVEAEERLRDSESRLRLAVAVARLGYWEWDLRTDSLKWSEENYRLHGLSPDQEPPRGTEFEEWIHPDDRARAAAEMRAALKGHREYDITHRITDATGAQRIVHSMGRVAERDEEGRALKILGTIQDVTEIVEHQVELERVASLLAQADAMALLAPYEWDPDQRVWWWSDQMYEVSGYTRETLPPGPDAVAQLVHPDDFERVRETWLDAARRREGWDVEYRLIDAAGGTHAVRDLAAWIPPEDGTGGIYRGAIQDITHLVELRERAEEAAAEVISIIDASLLPIIVIDEHGTVQRANGATERVFGWQVEDLVGQDVGLLASGVTLDEHASYISHYVSTGTASTPEGLVVGRTREVRGRRRDGSEFPAQLTVAEAELGTGRRQFVGIVMDLTEQKTTEEHLRQMQKSEALGTLVAGVAHDFNNLLTAIRGGIDMAQEFPEQPRWLEIATQAADRAAEVVRQLLRFSRRDEPQQVRLDAAEMIHEATTLSRETLDRRIWFTSHADEDLPPIVGDPGQMQQVLLNLIVNARDAVLERAEQHQGTYEPAIQVTARAASVDGNPGVIFEVRDNGTGMTDEVRNRAMDPFFTTKPTDRGTGLGLAAVAGIVQRHEGEIRIHTKLGEGTEVGVWLPSRTLVEPSSETGEDGTENVPPGPQQSPAILIVDDEEALGHIAAAYLQSAGFEALAFTNGQDALQEAEQRPVHLAILDVNMPSPNGWEVMAALRRRIPDLPILVSSGFTEEEEARSRGATAVLPKPYSREQLVEVVRAVLRDRV